MRFLGGEVPGSRAPGTRALHVALIALLAVLLSAFMLHATAAWAQTADEVEDAEAAQSESSPAEDEADSSEADSSEAEEGGSNDEASNDGASDDTSKDSNNSETDRQAKPAEDDEEDFERVITLPEAGEQDEDSEEPTDAEKITEAEDFDTLAEDDVVGEIALALDRDGDGEVDNIIIPRGDCEIQQGASIVLREDSQYGNGRGTFTDNLNVQITSNNNQIRIVGNNPNQPNEDINPRNASPGFDLEPGRTYEVIASSGINCDGGGGGGDGGNNGDCLSLEDLDNGGSAVIRSTGPVTGTVLIETNDVEDTSFVNFRVLYATSNPSGTLKVELSAEGDTAINTTIAGARRGVLNTQIKLNTLYNLDVTPQNQGFTILPEGGPGTGNDNCTSASQLPTPPGVAKDYVINDVIPRTVPLPDTGGNNNDTLTTADGERASTPASVLLSALSIMGFTGLLFLRRLATR